MADTTYTSRAHTPHDSAQSNDMGTKDGDGDKNSARMIRELEEEVRELTEKVASASQRFADYENEIRVLTAQVRQERRRNSSLTDEKTERSGLTRGFGSFMHARKLTPPHAAAPPSAQDQDQDIAALSTLLAESEAARLVAEAEVRKVHNEVEELTGSLFQEANGMVAEERKGNAKLRERVQFLEARDAKFAMRVRGLEERERERRGRLERLERAVGVVERVEGVLGKRGG